MNPQLEIQFFWPLTEQIPLDLDYTACNKPKYYVPSVPWGSIGPSLSGGTGYTFSNQLTNQQWHTTSISAGKLQLDVDTTVIKVNDKPPLLRRGLYKLLGIHWEIK
jgi:hypothetical protein